MTESGNGSRTTTAVAAMPPPFCYVWVSLDSLSFAGGPEDIECDTILMFIYVFILCLYDSGNNVLNDRTTMRLCVRRGVHIAACGIFFPIFFSPFSLFFRFISSSFLSARAFSLTAVCVCCFVCNFDRRGSA